MINYQDSKELDQSYEKYLSRSKSNIITRSIVCKLDDDLTHNDYLLAQNILTETGFLQDAVHSENIATLLQKFNWNLKDTKAKDCAESHYLKVLKTLNLQIDDQISDKMIQQTVELNQYDLGIYLDISK